MKDKNLVDSCQLSVDSRNPKRQTTNCKRPTLPPVVIDTRELLPYGFDGFDPPVETITRTLKTGDYSLAGYENEVAIERKSLSDLFGSLTNGRARFQREFERLADYRFAAVVVEAGLDRIADPLSFDPCWRSRANPNSILGSIFSWSVKYGVHWFPCPNRAFAERTTLRLLQNFHRHVTAEQATHGSGDPASRAEARSGVQRPHAGRERSFILK